MTKVFIIFVAFCLTSLVVGEGGLKYLASTTKETFQSLLGVLKVHAQGELITKATDYGPLSNGTITDPAGPDQLEGFVQYESWEGNACNGTKTHINGIQTNYCMMHTSGNGSYKLQISDGETHIPFSRA